MMLKGLLYVMVGILAVTTSSCIHGNVLSGGKTERSPSSSGSNYLYQKSIQHGLPHPNAIEQQPYPMKGSHVYHKVRNAELQMSNEVEPKRVQRLSKSAVKKRKYMFTHSVVPRLVHHAAQMRKIKRKPLKKTEKSEVSKLKSVKVRKSPKLPPKHVKVAKSMKHLAEKARIKYKHRKVPTISLPPKKLLSTNALIQSKSKFEFLTHLNKIFSYLFGWNLRNNRLSKHSDLYDKKASYGLFDPRLYGHIRSRSKRSVTSNLISNNDMYKERTMKTILGFIMNPFAYIDSFRKGKINNGKRFISKSSKGQMKERSPRLRPELIAGNLNTAQMSQGKRHTGFISSNLIHSSNNVNHDVLRMQYHQKAHRTLEDKLSYRLNQSKDQPLQMLNQKAPRTSGTDADTNMALDPQTVTDQIPADVKSPNLLPTAERRVNSRIPGSAWVSAADLTAQVKHPHHGLL